MEKRKIVINENLKELNSSGYEVSDGEPDIRGWKVKSADGKNIGKVKELLFDTASLRVRYVIFSLDGKLLNLLSRDIIIPVGLAELNTEDKYVLFPQVAVAHYASLPEYKKGEVSVTTEREIKSVFAPTKAVVYKDPDFNDPDFYSNEYFDEERMYKARKPVHREEIADNRHIIKEENTIARYTPISSGKKNFIDDETYYRKVGPNSFEPVDDSSLERRKFKEVAVSRMEAERADEIVSDREIHERRVINDPIIKREIDLNNLNKDDLPDD